MLTKYVHPRLGLPRFITLEPFFVDALEAFDKGNETLLTTTGGLSPSTVAARMRDSLQGYRINKRDWAQVVNPRFVELMAKHDGTFVIAGPDPNMQVWFRSRHKRKNAYAGPTFHEVEGDLPKFLRSKTVLAQNQGATPNSLAVRASNCLDETVRAYAQLKYAGEFAEQPIVFPGPISAELQANLIGAGDIAFHFDEQRQETVMV